MPPARNPPPIALANVADERPRARKEAKEINLEKIFPKSVTEYCEAAACKSSGIGD